MNDKTMKNKSIDLYDGLIEAQKLNNQDIELMIVRSREVTLAKISNMLHLHKEEMIARNASLVDINKRISARVNEKFNEFNDRIDDLAHDVTRRISDIIDQINWQKQEAMQKLLTDFAYIQGKLELLENMLKEDEKLVQFEADADEDLDAVETESFGHIIEFPAIDKPLDLLDEDILTSGSLYIHDIAKKNKAYSRLINRLRENNLTTLGLILERSEKEIRDIPGLGRECLDCLKEILYEKGFRLNS